MNHTEIKSHGRRYARRVAIRYHTAVAVAVTIFCLLAIAKAQSEGDLQARYVTWSPAFETGP